MSRLTSRNRERRDIHTATPNAQVQGVIDAITRVYSTGSIGIAAPCL